MDDDLFGRPSFLDAEIERQRYAVDTLRELAEARPPGDAAWGEVLAAQERLDELLRDQRARVGRSADGD